MLQNCKLQSIRTIKRSDTYILAYYSNNASNLLSANVPTDNTYYTLDTKKYKVSIQPANVPTDNTYSSGYHEDVKH
jgi:hypothetical protein